MGGAVDIALSLIPTLSGEAPTKWLGNQTTGNDPSIAPCTVHHVLLMSYMLDFIIRISEMLDVLFDTVHGGWIPSTI